jgi:hypothetical protein
MRWGTPYLSSWSVSEPPRVGSCRKLGPTLQELNGPAKLGFPPPHTSGPHQSTILAKGGGVDVAGGTGRSVLEAQNPRSRSRHGWSFRRLKVQLGASNTPNRWRQRSPSRLPKGHSLNAWAWIYPMFANHSGRISRPKERFQQELILPV